LVEVDELDKSSSVTILAVDTPVRLERAGRSFHERVREGYLELAGKEPGRFLVVDAGRPIDEIQGVIRERVGRLLTRRRRPRKES